MARVHGLHHVTAIAADPQENHDFYVHVLGMRLVKKTVNQDAIDTYHLFYADGTGTPGTDLTFFPWPKLTPGRNGAGLANEVALAVPPGSLSYWQQRLSDHGLQIGTPTVRFGETTLPLVDPHGLDLALVEAAGPQGSRVWRDSPVPVNYQIRGLHTVRLWQLDPQRTASFLVDVLGLEAKGAENGWHRFGVPGGGSGTLVDLHQPADPSAGSWGPGTVHHVAWRVEDSGEEEALREKVARWGLRPTQQIDRFWFQSVYFREPGGVLFELATDGPGFTADEDLEHLGRSLILPPWLENRREEIEADLPSIDTGRSLT